MSLDLGDCDVRGVHAGLGDLFYVPGVVPEFYDVHHGLDSDDNFLAPKKVPKLTKLFSTQLLFFCRPKSELDTEIIPYI